MSSRVILIARSSKDKHDVSCESQLHEMERFALDRGYTIIDKLEYSGVSHVDFTEDFRLAELMQQAKSKNRPFDRLLFYETSRLSRNRLTAQTIKALFRKAGVVIEFLKVQTQGEEAVDNLLEGILETVDQFHSDNARAGSRRGQRQNIRRGYRAGGRAPFGYRLVHVELGQNAENQPITKSKLEPDPINFPLVKEYLARRAIGETRISIYRDFIERNIKSPSGNAHWTRSSGVDIERNLLVYQGHLVYNRHARRIDGQYEGGKRFKDEAEWEIKRDQHEPAINSQQAAAIAAQLKKHEPTDETAMARSYLLTGILYCGDCGGPMVGDRGIYTCTWKKRRTQKCINRSIASTYLDQQVLTFLKEKLLTPEHFEKVLKESQKTYEIELSKQNSDIDRSNAEHTEIERQIERLVGLYSRGNLDSELLDKKVKELQARKQELAEQIQSGQQMALVVQLSKEQVSAKAIKDLMERFEALVSDENRDLMREFVRSLLFRIEVAPGGRKKRPVNLFSTIPAFNLKAAGQTRISLASPTGFIIYPCCW